MTASKLVGEVVTLSFNFLSQMGSGETLTSPVVTVSLFSGIDSTPAVILSGSPTISGSIVTQKIQEGMAGVTYVLTCAVHGSTGVDYIGTQLVSVLSDLGSFGSTSLPGLTGTLPDGIVGAAYSSNLAIADGYLPYEPVGIISGAPPWMGFSVVDSTLVCAGTPDEAAPASYTFSPAILDAALNQASSPQTIDITRTTTVGDLTDLIIGDIVSYQYSAINGTPPYTFSISSGSLPTGLSMNSAGLVTGTTTTSGDFSWTVQATDVNGVSDPLEDTANVSYAHVFAIRANVGPTNVLTTSIDGNDWPGTTEDPGINGTSAGYVESYAGRLFVIDTDKGRVSTDETNWADLVIPASGVAPDSMLRVGSTWFIFLSGSANCLESTDGVNFANRALSSNLSRAGSATNGTIICLSCNVGIVQRSTDGGTTWADIAGAHFGASSNGIIYTGSHFVLYQADNNAQLRRSQTGDTGTWNSIDYPGRGLGIVVRALATNGHGYVVGVLSNGNTIWSSDHGATFSAGATNAIGVAGSSLRYINGIYLCVVQTDILMSPDGIVPWTTLYTGMVGNGRSSIAPFRT